MPRPPRKKVVFRCFCPKAVAAAIAQQSKVAMQNQGYSSQPIVADLIVALFLLAEKAFDQHLEQG